MVQTGGGVRIQAGAPAGVSRIVGTPLAGSSSVIASTVGTTETVLATFTIPKEELQVGATFYLELFGIASRTSSAPTVTLRYRMASVSGTLLAVTPAIGAPISTITRRGWANCAVLKVTEVGETGSFLFSADQELQIDQTNGFDIQNEPDIDTSSDLTIVMTVQFSANTAGNTIEATAAHILRVV